MGMQYEQEWAEAQKIALSVDLVEAAKNQLKFLAAVDRNRFLYEDHALQRAIYRYNAFWLPLLAKHVKNPVSEDPLVVPLDCEWIWHCHRLNPVRYISDCEKLFGRILGNHNIISSVDAPSKSASEEIWKRLYPEEPYELDLNRPFSGDVWQKSSLSEKFTSYDLVSAVRRQIPFAFQVSRPYMSDDLFLREAMARYKGFLHLVRTNRKMSLKRFCVPTYDVDLMWHTHQLYPDCYCKDMIELVGSVVQHDDTVYDRTKGKKLDIGQSETSRQWEQTFGFSYWKAGAMHRGSVPTPVTQVPYEFNVEGKEFNTIEKCGLQILIPTVKTVEVLLEFLDIKNLSEEHKGNILVVFSKKNPDKLFNTKRSLGISSECKEKPIAIFQCEAKGEFLFELMSHSTPNEPKPKSLKLLGSCALSLEEMLASQSQLATNKWVSVDLVSETKSAEPILLHVSISFTPAPQVFQLARSQPFEHAEFQTHVMDNDGNKVLGLQTRNRANDSTNGTPALGKEVYCITDSGKKHALVEFNGNFWSIKGTHGSFKLQISSGNDDSLFELVGYKMVKLFPGRRLDFEPRHNKEERSEQEFMTAVEFSTDNPYGKAVALIDTKSETIKVTDEWIILPGIAMAFILSDILREEGQSSNFTKRGLKNIDGEMVKNGGKVMNDGQNMGDDGATHGGGVKVEASLCARECVDVLNKKGYGAQCGPCVIDVCEDAAGLLDMPEVASDVSNKEGYGGNCGVIVVCDDAAGLLDMPKEGYGGNCGVIVVCDDAAGALDMPKMVSAILSEPVAS